MLAEIALLIPEYGRQHGQIQPAKRDELPPNCTRLFAKLAGYGKDLGSVSQITEQNEQYFTVEFWMLSRMGHPGVRQAIACRQQNCRRNLGKGPISPLTHQHRLSFDSEAMERKLPRGYVEFSNWRIRTIWGRSMMMEPQLTITTYSAASEIQPAQLTRLLNELEALADRARQIIKPAVAWRGDLDDTNDGKLGMPITREMLLDEAVEFDFSKLSG